MTVECVRDGEAFAGGGNKDDGAKRDMRFDNASARQARYVWTPPMLPVWEGFSPDATMPDATRLMSH
ncbi:hypothetical protein ACM9XA_11680 [Xanthomonas sacchari]